MLATGEGAPGAPFVTLEEKAGPKTEVMTEGASNAKKGTYSLLQVRDYSIATEKILGMSSSCCCLGCCFFSTLKIEYLDKETNRKWTQKFRFCCDETAAYETQVKINEYMGNKILS
jgi:hypothetical protein